MHCLEYQKILSVHDVLKALDQSGLGFVVVLKEQKFFGIVTDGDARRGILNSSSVEQLVNTKAYTVQKRDLDNVDLKALIDKYRYVPVLDGDNFIKMLGESDSLLIEDCTIVIMAGGLGKRLGELTKHVPKPMILVAGKPIIQAVIENFKSCGFKKFIITLNYLGEQIENYFEDGSKFGVKITYVTEPKRLGTAGSLSLISSVLDTNYFFVSNADVISSVNFESLFEFHQKNRSDVTLVTRIFGSQIPYGVVMTNEVNDYLDIKEKPTFNYNINTGIYVLCADILDELEINMFLDMPDLIKLLQTKGKKIKIFESDSYWIDLGHKDDLDNYAEKISE